MSIIHLIGGAAVLFAVLVLLGAIAFAVMRSRGSAPASRPSNPGYDLIQQMELMGKTAAGRKVEDRLGEHYAGEVGQRIAAALAPLAPASPQGARPTNAPPAAAGVSGA